MKHGWHCNHALLHVGPQTGSAAHPARPLRTPSTPHPLRTPPLHSPLPARCSAHLKRAAMAAVATTAAPRPSLPMAVA